MSKAERDVWASPFYSSSAWINCRRRYAKSVGGLCECCLKRGLYTPGTQVHHKNKLTPENVNNPEVALNWDNLELLCRDCHLEVHEVNHHRWVVGEDGELEIRTDLPPS